MQIWFVSEVFDASGVTTGYYLAQIAEALRRKHNVRVITSKRGAHEGPRLEHLATSVVQRGFRTMLSSITLATRALLRLRRGDIAIVVTNPPALPILMAVVAKVRRARLIVLVHDVYPDVLLAARVWRRNGVAARVFDFMNGRALAIAERVIVIGRDMQKKVAAKLKSAARVEYIPNWANDEILASPISPRTRTGPLVVQYSGNMGVTHGVETLLDCATLLAQESDKIRFELVGWGLKLPFVRTAIRQRSLQNITLLPPAPRADLGAHLARCDVALILMVPGTAGSSVPCRFYNILAAGKPVIVAADYDSEIATVVREKRLGWVVAPNSPMELAEALRDAHAHAAELPPMGLRGRVLAVESYSFERAAAAYNHLIETMARSS